MRETSASSAWIEVRRSAQFANRLRRIEVRVDGHRGLVLAHGESGSLRVAPGRHRLEARLDWARSPEVAVELAPGARCRLVLACAARGWRLPLVPWYLLRPRSYLTLEVQGPATEPGEATP